SSKGEYMGGAIAPGLAISAEALFERAARLPRVDIRRPPKVIGRNTTHSLQAGLFYGYIALVQGILERMRQEMGEKVRTIGEGGRRTAARRPAGHQQHLRRLRAARARGPQDQLAVLLSTGGPGPERSVPHTARCRGGTAAVARRHRGDHRGGAAHRSSGAPRS